IDPAATPNSVVSLQSPLCACSSPLPNLLRVPPNRSIQQASGGAPADPLVQIHEIPPSSRKGMDGGALLC
ncbi:unnamed protein product, partial [Urochloa humidicola]